MVTISIPNTACPLDLFRGGSLDLYWRSCCFRLLHLFFFLLLFFEDGLFDRARLLFCFLVRFCSCSFLSSSLCKTLFIDVFFFEGSHKRQGLLKQNLRDFSLENASYAIGPGRLGPARDIRLNLVVFLVKLVDLDFALACAPLIINFLGLPVDLSFELKHRHLFLLPYRHGGRTFELFNFVDLDLSVGFAHFNVAPLLNEEFLCEVRIVLLFPVPVALVPN